MFSYRPRPEGILPKKEYAKLRSDYRSLYGKQYREEEKKDRQSVQEEVAEKKKAIRDEFLNNFYLPLRHKYEADMEKYIKMWPLKDSDMTEQPETITHVYNYGDLLEMKKIEGKD